MNNYKDYLSEFENEFEANDISSEYDGENGQSDEFEFENDFSNESNDEYELDSEFEANDEYELDSEFETNDEYEFENEQIDSEMENYLQESGSRDQEFEDRVYAALSGEHESSFEMEQEIDRVLHEMEIEYFWKKYKNKIMKIAKMTPLGASVSALGKLAGGDVRNFLKKGVMMAANTYLPGVGGMIAGKLLNSETAAAKPLRAQAQQVVAVAKDAYRNMGQLMPSIKPGNVPRQINRYSRQAVMMARRRHARRGGVGTSGRRVIRIRPGATVIVKRDRVIIY